VPEGQASLVAGGANKSGGRRGKQVSVAGSMGELSVGCAGAISMFIGTVMSSWLVLWAGVFAPAD
jgi:hypothetical protein